MCAYVPPKDQTCAVCGEKAKIHCTNCGETSYCSIKHQVTNWADHKERCAYYKVANDNQNGNHLVASRAIPAGTVILVEKPLIVGPMGWSSLFCLGCNDIIDKSNVHRCPNCSWPLCSQECAYSDKHKPECVLLSSDRSETKKVVPKDLDETPLYDLIMVLRCLNLKSVNPEGWAKILPMISHSTQRMANNKDQHHKATVIFIHRYLLHGEFSIQELSHVRGVIYSNSLSFTRSSGVKLRGVYPTQHLINHSCIPNVQHSITSDGTLYLHATVNIPESEKLVFNYVGTMEPFWERFQALNENYYFTCKCKLCNDPTENNTYFSSPKCKKCPMFMNPTLHEGIVVFKCSHCQTLKPLNEILKELEIWESRLKSEAMFSDMSPCEIEVELLKLENSFHSSHYIWYKVTHEALHSLAGKRLPEAFELRCKIWQRILDAVNVFEPGITRRRGMVLLETGMVFFSSALVAHTEKWHDQATFKITSDLELTIAYIQEAVKCLKLEPEGSRVAHLKYTAEERLNDAHKVLHKITTAASMIVSEL